MTVSEITNLKKHLALKYLADRILGLVAVLMLLPLYLFIIVALCAEKLFHPEARGPLFWRETRISAGIPFHFIKFRTLKKQVLSGLKNGESLWKYQRNRGNLTFVGKMLTLFYWDELPQFFLILTGKMSCVGPRPKPPAEYRSEMTEGYQALQFLKGGLTGPYQLRKGRPDFSRKLNEDYLKACSQSSSLKLLLLDFRILIQSFLKMLKAEGL